MIVIPTDLPLIPPDGQKGVFNFYTRLSLSGGVCTKSQL